MSYAYKANVISTIVDGSVVQIFEKKAYKANVISTIVD